MTPHFFHARTAGSPPARTISHGGFTLVEVSVGIMILGLIAASIIWALNQLNHYATANRLFTQAQTICQNQVDRVLTAGPYNPTAVPAQTPSELMPGQAPSNVKVSEGPGNPVTGTMTTAVTNTGLQYNGTDLNVKQASVTVTYTFRNRQYSIVMNTLRAPDQ
jgi:prepilin-type N-terminal cleavage/methylation domain-containing protein